MQDNNPMAKDPLWQRVGLSLLVATLIAALVTASLYVIATSVL